MLSQVQLLKKYRIRIRGHLGQHLLMDPNTIRKIADALALEANEPVFEIGPGLGAMTRELLERGHPVVAVEKDSKFIEVLQAELSPHFPGLLELTHQDILKCDLQRLLGPKTAGGRCLKVIGNLPYYISTPILFHLIEHRELFHSAVFTLQKEVAMRMAAKVGEEDYGRLSVSANLFGTTESLFDISPKCFLPAPEVTSRVVRYIFRQNLILENEDFLLELIRIAFSQRRKTLLSLLLKTDKVQKSRAELELILQKLDFSLQVRGEVLTTAQFTALSKLLK